MSGADGFMLHACYLCGRTIPADQEASVTEERDGGLVTWWLCHRNDESPTCYIRWTVQGHRPKAGFHHVTKASR